MQFPQVCHLFTRLSSPPIQPLLILLFFAGNLSTAPTETPAEQPITDYVASYVPLDAGARVLLNTSTSDGKINPQGGNNSEAADLLYSIVSKRNDTVDSDEDVVSGENDATTVTSTQSGISESTTTPTTTTVIANSTAVTSVNASIITNATVESTPAVSSSTSSTSSSSPSLTSSTETTTVEATTARTTLAMAVVVLETDPLEDVTATAVIKDNDGMPAGVVAIVTMVTFIIIAVVAYVGLIVWRRYLEYRYGNRELLVNNLEFDTNDLHHFEL